MSWYNTVVLSFSEVEFDEDDDDDEDEDGDDLDRRDCVPLRKLDAWLERRKYEPLAPIGTCELGSNAVLFGGCYNYLEIDKFCKYINKLKWKSLEEVRVLFWGDNDTSFTLVEFPL